MAGKLLIVESPNKAKTIRTFPSMHGWNVVASMGHILDLPRKEIGVEAPDYAPKYVPVNEGRGLNAILAAARDATEIYIATDPDREGEAIASHIAKRIAKSIGVRKTRRVRFGAVSDADVRKAITESTTVDEDLALSQEARRVLDRLVGYKVSPKLSRVTGLDGLSAGRVQSPAVRIVVEREREISKFVATPYFDVVLTFQTEGLEWKAAWDARPYLVEGAEHNTDKALADDIARTSPVVIATVEQRKAERRPPPPLITSTMQRAASVSLKIRPADAMKFAQELFEAGHITYHRTDNPNLDDESASSIRTWLQQNGHAKAIPVKAHRWTSKAGAQEGHPAIAPKHVEHLEVSNVSAGAQQLYRLIWLRAVASQMRAAIYDVTDITLEGTSPAGRAASFGARGQVMIDAGWTSLYSGRDDDDEDEDDASRPLPRLTPGGALKPIAGETVTKKTRPPPRFTEASLIKALEDLGIGRPSTYASIMKNIDERGYIKVDKKQQISAPALGCLVVDMLVPIFRFMDLQFTRMLETQLDAIASGTMTYKTLVQNLDVLLDSELAKLMPPAPHLIPAELRGSLASQTTETFPCPACSQGRLHRRKAGKSAGYFWGCDRYSRDDPASCKHTQPDIDGRPGTREEAAARASKASVRSPKGKAPKVARSAQARA